MPRGACRSVARSSSSTRGLTNEHEHEQISPRGHAGDACIDFYANSIDIRSWPAIAHETCTFRGCRDGWKVSSVLASAGIPFDARIDHARFIPPSRLTILVPLLTFARRDLAATLSFSPALRTLARVDRAFVAKCFGNYRCRCIIAT